MGEGVSVVGNEAVVIGREKGKLTNAVFHDRLETNSKVQL